MIPLKKPALALLTFCLNGALATHSHYGTYSSYYWLKDPALFSPWMTLEDVAFETVCATACSNDHRRGKKWCTGYQYDGSAKTCLMFPVSKEDVEIVPDPANPPTGRPIFKARTEDLGHTSNYVFWAPACDGLNSALFSKYLPPEAEFYCDSMMSWMDGVIIDTEVEVVVNGESPLQKLDNGPVFYVEETDVLVSCCARFLNSIDDKLPQCWAKKLNLKNSNGPEPWKGPYNLQIPDSECYAQKVGTKVFTFHNGGTLNYIEYFDTTDFSVHTLMDSNGANVYVGVDAGAFNSKMCLMEADSKTLLSLGGNNRKFKADVLNVKTGFWSSLPDFSVGHSTNAKCGFVTIKNKVHLVMIAGATPVIEFLDWEKKDEWKTISGWAFPGLASFFYYKQMLIGSIGDEDRSCDLSILTGSAVTHCLLPDGIANSKLTVGRSDFGDCPVIAMSAHIFKPCFIPEL